MNFVKGIVNDFVKVHREKYIRELFRRDVVSLQVQVLTFQRSLSIAASVVAISAGMAMAIAWLVFAVASTAGTASASMTMSSTTTVVTPVMPTDGYKLALHVESYDAPLLFLAQFPLNAGGAFTVSVDLTMPLSVPDGDFGRSLLYLLACDVEAMVEIGGLDNYCAMPNRTLADLCVSFPLPDRAISDHMVYRAQTVVSGTAVRDLGIRSSDAGPTTFLLDACETVGGQRGVLRSCLDTMNGQSDNGECFYCPATGALPGPYADCIVPPEIQPTMSGGVWMNLCDSSGECLTAASSFSTAYGAVYSTRASLPLFYAVVALVWGAASFVWSVHIQAAMGKQRSNRPGRVERARRLVRARRADGPVGHDTNGNNDSSGGRPSNGSDSLGREQAGSGPSYQQPPPPPPTQVVIALQQKMRGVPISQCVSSALTAGVLYLEMSASVPSSGSSSGLVEFITNATIISVVIAIALMTEMLLLLAKGWQITRAELPYRERQWLRVLAYVFGTLTCLLRYAQRVKHVVVVLLWGASWALVVGSIWFHSALNLNALRYQLAVLRQHMLAIQQHLAATSNANGSPPPPPPLDIRRTPVFVKLQLFRRYRALLAAYLFASCVFSVAGLATDSTDGAWQWTTLAGGDGLTFLLAIAMGYTFRCRRFRELLPSENREAGPAAGGTRIVPEPVVMTPPPEPVKKKSAMVVVVNPDRERALGTSYTIEQVPGEGEGNANGSGGSNSSKKCAEQREPNT